MTHQTISDDKVLVCAEDDQCQTRPLQFDPEKYRHMLDTIELTEAEKDEMLGVLWEIMQSFVLLGWGLDPTQSVFASIAQKAWAASEERENSLAKRDAVIQQQEEGATSRFNKLTLVGKEESDD